MNAIRGGLFLGGVLVLGAAGCAAGDDTSARAEEAAALEAEGFQQAAPAGVRFTSVAASGAGCPQNTPGDNDSYFADITPERDAFTLEFYKFKAQVTSTDAQPSTSLACTVRLGLAVPAGYAFTVTDIVYQGESNLPAGTSASLVTSYGYQGSGIAPVSITHAIRTPSTLQQFKFHDILDGSTTGSASQSSRCGEAQVLNLNLALQIRNAQKKEGWAELSFADSEVRTTREDPTPSAIPGVTVKVAWKRCPTR